MGLFGGGTNVTTESKNLVNEIVVNRCSYGTCVPDICGTTRASANIINYQDITSTKHTKTTSSGGKGGGGSTSTQISYTYNVFLELALSEGPISGIGRVWVGGELNYDKDDYGTIGMPLSYMLGNQTSANAYMLSNHPDKAQVYTGLAYAYGYIYLGSGTTVPQYAFEVKGHLLSTGDGVDCNPADYIAYVLGKIGINTSNVDGLANYRKYCAQANLLISTPMDQDTQAARDVINRVLELTNAFMFWSNDRFKIVIKEDRSFGTWTPDLSVKYALDSSDFIEQDSGAMVVYERKPVSEIYNRFSVSYNDRSNAYETTSVSYEDVQDINAYGLRQAPSEDCEFFYTKSRALHYLGVLARNNKYGRNKYTFKLNWAYALLEPGDIVTLTDSCLGIDKLPVRVISVTEEADSTISVSAVSIPALSNLSPSYNVQEIDYNVVSFNVEPDDTDTPIFYQPPGALATTNSGNDLIVALKGEGSEWGGCTVYASLDNETYELTGTFYGESCMGHVGQSCGASDTTIKVSVNTPIISSTQLAQEDGRNYILIGDEIISYRETQLNADGTYSLFNCYRGLLQTTAAAHNTSDRVLRLDGNYHVLSVLPENVGKTYYFKLPSFNNYKTVFQQISDCEPFTYVPTTLQYNGVTNVTASVVTNSVGAGLKSYSVLVKWTPPSDNTYSQAQLVYKAPGDTNWTYAGAGYASASINGVQGTNSTYKYKVLSEDIYGNVQAIDSVPEHSIVVDVTPVSEANVSITDNGLKASKSSGEYSLVNADGISFYNASLQLNSRLGRMICGKAQGGKTITFTSPWPSAPVVVCSSGTASNITVNGFTLPSVSGDVMFIAYEGTSDSLYSVS